MNGIPKAVVGSGLMLAATAAAAHPGHAESGLASGLLHPMLGLDHLLAMIAIGLWSLRQKPSLRTATPALMVAGMVLGAGLAFAGVTVPGLETGIALTVMVAGLLIATLTRLPTLAAAPMIVFFMALHGSAHGSEMPVGASAWLYVVGFSATTAGLAVGTAKLADRLKGSGGRATRALGAVIAFSGAILAS